MTYISIQYLRDMRQRDEKIAVVTSYDASFTKHIEAAGVEVILVGDSLGMVLQGHDSTLPVTVDDMVYHTKLVARARELFAAEQHRLGLCALQAGIRALEQRRLRSSDPGVQGRHRVRRQVPEAAQCQAAPEGRSSRSDPGLRSRRRT